MKKHVIYFGVGIGVLFVYSVVSNIIFFSIMGCEMVSAFKIIYI